MYLFSSLNFALIHRCQRFVLTAKEMDPMKHVLCLQINLRFSLISSTCNAVFLAQVQRDYFSVLRPEYPGFV